MLGKGYQVRTTDGIIGISGSPKAIYAIHFLSSGSAGTVDVHDGTDTTGTKVFSIVGVATQTTSVDFGGMGIVLHAGCYLNIDASVSSVTIVYQELL